MVGAILEMQNRFDDAREKYEQALGLDPRTPLAANNLAWYYAERNQKLDTALQLAQSAKAELPNDARISDTLGWVLYQKGYVTSAITSLKEAAKQAPKDPGIRYRLGLAYLKNDDVKAAREALELSVRLNPTSTTAADARRVLDTIKS